MRNQRIRSTKSKADKQLGVQTKPNFSGAFIRSLVKQLTSRNPKGGEAMESERAVEETSKDDVADNMAKQPEEIYLLKKPKKKQVRRRLHTTRPYQEKLMDMAEARREIVMALKYHRASMQYSTNAQSKVVEAHTSSPTTMLTTQSCHVCLVKSSLTTPSEAKIMSPCGHCFCWACFEQCFKPPPPFSTILCPICSTALQTQNVVAPMNSKSSCQQEPPQYVHESPTHQDYGFSNCSNLLPSQECYADVDESRVMPSTTKCSSLVEESGSKKWHVSVREEELAEIKSIGEKHDIEWNDTLNLLRCAWWFKFISAMELPSCSQDEDDFPQCFDHEFEALPSSGLWLDEFMNFDNH